MTFGLSSYKTIRRYRLAPVWSGVWTQLRNSGQEFSTTIPWKSYVSPYELPAQRPEAFALLEKARQRQELDAKRKAAWLEENSVDATPYVARWDDLATEIRDELLNIAVATFPMVDGLEQANETIKYGFEMKEAEIDRREFSSVITSLFRLKVFQWAIPRILGTDDPALVSEVMRRVAAREIPTRDNIGPTEKRSTVAQNIQNDIATMLARQRTERKPFAPFGKRRQRDAENSVHE